MTDPISRWVDEHRNARPIAYLLEHRSATIAQLADIAGQSIERTVADMGGLHDWGIVTRYGTEPQSIVRWQHHA